MHRFLLAMAISAALARGGCRGSDDPKPAVIPAPSAASAAPAEAPAPFAVVDLLDFGRREVRNFAYCNATQELFVSFSDRWRAEVETMGDAVYQWDLAESRLAHTYRLEQGFIVDQLHPSPDGRRLVVALFRSDNRGSDPWEKFALLDTAQRAIVKGDLGHHDDRTVEVDFSPGAERVRAAPAAPSAPPARERGRPWRGRPWVIESSKGTLDTHGLYYTDADGTDHRITPNHWNANYAITRDGQFVVTTTWDGEILAWSTAAKRVVFQKKLADQYGYLAYDEKNDRFLIGDAMYNGTTYLRALVRGHAK